MKQARENRPTKTRTTRRISAKISLKSTPYSKELSSLTYEESESEDESSEDEENINDPLWILYNYIRNYSTPSGVNLAEPFLSLPSKRELPDYYQVIMEPISLNLIRKKLKLNEYSQLVDLADDLHTMFENCKTYNRSDSRLYKEGVKLQKIMNNKLDDLESQNEHQQLQLRKAESEEGDEESSGGNLANFSVVRRRLKFYIIRF